MDSVIWYYLLGLIILYYAFDFLRRIYHEGVVFIIIFTLAMWLTSYLLEKLLW